MLFKRFLTLGLCFLLSAMLASAATDSLRVLALNAEWFPGQVPEPSATQQSRHIAKMQQLFYDLNPDLMVLQEIVKSDAVETALKVLPDSAVYAVSAFSTNPLQLAIAGRLPCVAAEARDWPLHTANPLLPPRGFVVAWLTLPNDGVLLVYSLHLKSNWKGDPDYDEKNNIRLREHSVKLLLDHVNSVSTRFPDQVLKGVLLGGDFNTLYPTSFLRGERTVDLLKAGGFEHLGSHGLDHFWGRGISNATFSVFNDYAVSDHAPIMLEIPVDHAISRQTPVDPATLRDALGSLLTDVNRAQRSELMSLPRIGPVLAQRIIEGRPFGSLDEMADVCGIGPKTLQRIAPYVEVIPASPKENNEVTD